MAGHPNRKRNMRRLRLQCSINFNGYEERIKAVTAGRNLVQAATRAAGSQTPLHHMRCTSSSLTWQEEERTGHSLLGEPMAQDSRRQQGLVMQRRKREKISVGHVSRQYRLAPCLPSLLCRRARGYSVHLENLSSSSILSLAPGFRLPS